MTRVLGVLCIVVVLYGALMATDENARSANNQQEIAKRVGYYGIMTVGVGLLIITGGIDLSIGSVVGLAAVCYALLLQAGWPPFVAVAYVLAGGSAIGWIHGLLVTKVKLQPFLVTLCGLFIYRGLAQLATWWPSGNSARNVGLNDAQPHLTSEGFRNQFETVQWLLDGRWFGLPTVFLVTLTLTAVLAYLLHGTVWGRYWYAIGYNEVAARYAGIDTDRFKVLAYVICSSTAALTGIAYMNIFGSGSPTEIGNWWELYAITGAVLGGCSLRGGQGTAVGILLGTAALPLLRQFCLFARLPQDLEFSVIGVALLLGTLADELLRRWTRQ